LVKGKGDLCKEFNRRGEIFIDRPMKGLSEVGGGATWGEGNDRHTRKNYIRLRPGTKTNKRKRTEAS